MPNEIAQKNNGALAESDSLAARVGLTESQLQLVRTQIAPGAPDDVLEFYFARCKQLGFDPLSKMLFAIPRGGWKEDAAGNFVYANGKKVWDARKSWTFQTSIDGFRSIGESMDGYAGQDGPYWCGDNGQWTDVWLKREPPAAAKVGIYRRGFDKPLYAVAVFEEYAQKDKDGGLTGLWSKMAATMIAKCAEALAFRKAFPQRLAGVYTTDEMQQAKNDGPAEELPAPKRGGNKKVEQAAQLAALPAGNDTAEAAQVAEIVETMQEPEPGEPPTEQAILERYQAINAGTDGAPKIATWFKTIGIDLSKKPKVNGKVTLSVEERRKAAIALDELEVAVHARKQLTPEEQTAPEAEVVDELPLNANPHADSATGAGESAKEPSIDDPCDSCNAKPGELCAFWCGNAEIEAWPEGGRADQPDGDHTRNQGARIALLCKDEGITDEQRHCLIWFYYEPKWSIKHLSKAEADAFIQRLLAYKAYRAKG